MKLLERLRFKAEYTSVCHKRNITKPNEDRVLVDEERGIFILLDGVTRAHHEYESTPYESAAGDLGDIFIDLAYKYIVNNISDPEPENILRGAIKVANEKIREYRKRKSEEEWSYYPSTLGFVSIIRDGVLHYIATGDCLGVLIRRSVKILLGREWTLEAVDKLCVTKAERYSKYCNHPENRLSYTVFNGDDEVMDGIEYSFIDLHSGDTLLIASDGLGDYIKFEKSMDLILQTPEQMIANSDVYDRPPFAEYADDKTIIKLSFM